MQSLAVDDHNGKLVTGSEEPQHVQEAYTFEFRSWIPRLPRISDQVYEDGTRYGLASPNVQAAIAKIPSPLRTAWRATMEKVGGALDDGKLGGLGRHVQGLKRDWRRCRLIMTLVLPPLPLL